MSIIVEESPALHWATWTDAPYMKQVRETHVMPEYDYKPHEMSSKCWCRPDTEDEGFFVHNSMDGREDFEEGRRQIS